VGYTGTALLLTLGLFVGMFVCLEVGRRIGERVERHDPGGAHSGTGAVEGGVFALLGLIIAFSFSGAASRFDARRELIVQEANDIGTAYLRVNQLPAPAQPAVRDLFRRYLDARLAVYAEVTDPEVVQAKLAAVAELQRTIWEQAGIGCAAAPTSACAMLLLPALNAMFDTATSRVLATRLHPPLVVFWLLFGLSFGCALLAGYSMASGTARKWTHMIAFAAVTACSVYVILDLEFPRIGLIRVDEFDQALVEVRASMDR
jgi:hypothetical protein